MERREHAITDKTARAMCFVVSQCNGRAQLSECDRRPHLSRLGLGSLLAMPTSRTSRFIHTWPDSEQGAPPRTSFDASDRTEVNDERHEAVLHGRAGNVAHTPEAFLRLFVHGCGSPGSSSTIINDLVMQENFE